MLNGWPWYFCKMLGIIPMLFLPHSAGPLGVKNNQNEI